MGGSPAKPRLNCHREVLAAAAARWPPSGSVAGDWHMPTGPAIRCPRTPLPSPSRAGMAQACSPPLPERSQARAPLARICAPAGSTAVSRPSMPGDMAMRQTELHLTDEDRAAVDEIRRKGRHHAREVNRAHVLHSLD